VRIHRPATSLIDARGSFTISRASFPRKPLNLTAAALALGVHVVELRRAPGKLAVTRLSLMRSTMKLVRAVPELRPSRPMLGTAAVSFTIPRASLPRKALSLTLAFLALGVPVFELRRMAINSRRTRCKLAVLHLSLMRSALKLLHAVPMLHPSRRKLGSAAVSITDPPVSFTTARPKLTAVQAKLSTAAVSFIRSALKLLRTVRRPASMGT
jgi:hypothetical protein